MFAKFPEDDRYFSWTRHIKNKMMFYGLSTQKIKTILKSPTRREEGIAPNTIAVMKRNDTKKRKEEIWVMYQDARGKEKATSDKSRDEKPKQKSKAFLTTLTSLPPRKVMISAWRYPGHTKPGADIPIPEDILEELNKLVN